MIKEVDSKIEKMEDFNQSYFEQVSSTIERMFKREKLRMGLYSPDGDVLASESSANLRKVLAMKADKVDLERLYELKSNKVDTDSMIGSQHTISKQFQHILVLFIEVISLLQTRPNDT
jgi:hypothetical protein